MAPLVMIMETSDAGRVLPGFSFLLAAGGSR
jgi:hypothetical protein